MKTYTITLTTSIEAESEDEALETFLQSATHDWNTGENIEIEEEKNQ